MSLTRTINLRKNILIPTLVASILAGMSMNSEAFDLNDALKDAVKNKLNNKRDKLSLSKHPQIPKTQQLRQTIRPSP